MSKSGGGGGRTAGRDRSEKPKKDDAQDNGKLAKAPPGNVNADTANDNARAMRAAARKEAAARAGLRGAFGS